MIQIEGLYFSYKSPPPYLLDNINLTVNDGDYVSVLGGNGSGKSTLIKLILGFLTPAGGVITNTFGRPGYVPQKSEASNSGFPITVYEMLNSYRKVLHIKDRNAVNRCLERFDMSGFRNALVGTLSGGQFQKVFIGRALMGNPRLLILDEPSTGIDPDSQREVYRLLKKLNREDGITIISVEHNLAAAMDNSSVIYHMAKGSAHRCTPDEYAREFLNERLD